MLINKIPVMTGYQKFAISDAAQVAWETAVPRTFEFGGLVCTPRPTKNKSKINPKGVLLPTGTKTGHKEIPLDISGEASYEELDFFITSVSSDVAPTAMEPRTVECGPMLIHGVMVNGWNLKGNDESLEFSATAWGLDWVTAAPTAALSPVDPTPMLNDHVTITIGGVEIETLFDWELSVGGLWNPQWYVGSNIPKKAKRAKNLDAAFTINFECDAAGLTRWVSDAEVEVVLTIDSGVAGKKLAITFDAEPLDQQPLEDNDDVYGAGLVYAIKHSPSATRDAIEVVWGP